MEQPVPFRAQYPKEAWKRYLARLRTWGSRLYWYVEKAAPGLLLYKLLEDRVVNWANQTIDAAIAPSGWIEAARSALITFDGTGFGFYWNLVAITTVVLLFLAYRDTQKSVPVDTPHLTGFFPRSSDTLLPRNNGNRERLVVLVRACACPTYVVAQQVTNKIWDSLRNNEDYKIQLIALFYQNCVLVPCNYASAALSRAVDDPTNKEDIELLQQRLREFFEQYQSLLRWTKRVSSLYYSSPSDHPRYGAWKEKHKVFYQELAKFIASDDSLELRERLRGQWEEIDE